MAALPRTARTHLRIRMQTWDRRAGSGLAFPEGGSHWCCWERDIPNRRPWSVIPSSRQIHLSRFSEAELFAAAPEGRNVRRRCCCCFLGCCLRGSDYARTVLNETCLRRPRMMTRPKFPSAMPAGKCSLRQYIETIQIRLRKHLELILCRYEETNFLSFLQNKCRSKKIYTPVVVEVIKSINQKFCDSNKYK